MIDVRLIFVFGIGAFFLGLWFKKTDCFQAIYNSLSLIKYGLVRFRCEHCRRWSTFFNSTVRLEDSRTMYHYDGEWFDSKNPNRPVILCCCCANLHHDYWNDMWTEYYSSVSHSSPKYSLENRCKHV